MVDETRCETRIPCDIILNKVQNGHTHVARATNISMGGIRLQRLLEPLQPHSDKKSVRLQLSLADGEEPIWVTAKSVYEDEDYVGLRFTFISHKHFVKLREWLSGGKVIAQCELAEIAA